MPPTMPQFPALDAWQQMDESEQDALIARIEAARRRKALGGRLLTGFAVAALGAGLGFALYLALS